MQKMQKLFKYVNYVFELVLEKYVKNCDVIGWVWCAAAAASQIFPSNEAIVTERSTLKKATKESCKQFDYDFGGETGVASSCQRLRLCPRLG